MTFPVFPEIHFPDLESLILPDFVRLRLRQPRLPALKNLPVQVAKHLEKSELFDLPEGSSVAVAVGSRGIADIETVVRASVDWLKTKGFVPFIVPGVGSHGGGTAEGQKAVLEKLGISSDRMGCEIRATMQTVKYGTLNGGIICHFDANAAAADGVLVINRVKAHTSFPRDIESGLTKMLAVGLGKAEGAGQVHMIGPRGFVETLPALADMILKKAPITAGLAVVENAHKQLSHVEVVAPSHFSEADARLLKTAKSGMARLPFDQLDGLLIERLGKEISGAGIDPAVSGRTDIRGVENPSTPFIHKIAVLAMTERTDGNGIGVGMADFIPCGMANKLDLKAMYMNALTSTILEKARIPIVLPDERSVIAAMVATCWNPKSPRLCHIISSAQLDEIAVTPNLLPEIREQGLILEVSDPFSLTFDKLGNLSIRLEG